MKRIINKGYEKFTATCDKCNCTFEYELEDVSYSASGIYYIHCPKCGYGSDHLANVKHMRSVDAFVDSFNKGE